MCLGGAATPLDRGVMNSQVLAGPRRVAFDHNVGPFPYSKPSGIESE